MTHSNHSISDSNYGLVKYMSFIRVSLFVKTWLPGTWERRPRFSSRLFVSLKAACRRSVMVADPSVPRPTPIYICLLQVGTSSMGNGTTIIHFPTVSPVGMSLFLCVSSFCLPLVMLSL